MGASAEGGRLPAMPVVRLGLSAYCLLFTLCCLLFIVFFFLSACCAERWRGYR